MSPGGHPHHQTQHCCSVASTGFQSYGTGSQLLPPLPVVARLRAGVGNPLQLHQDLSKQNGFHLKILFPVLPVRMVCSPSAPSQHTVSVVSGIYSTNTDLEKIQKKIIELIFSKSLMLQNFNRHREINYFLRLI